jgi:hypothetical protein
MLPWPPGWQVRPDPGLVLSFVFLAVVAIGMASVAVMERQGGDPSLTLVTGGLAILLTLILVWTWPLLRMRRQWRARVVTVRTIGSGERGVCIPNSAWLYRWLVTVVAVMGASSGAMLWAVLGMGVDGVATKFRDIVLALVSIVVVPYCSWFLVDVVRGRIVRGQVVLTLQGVRYRSIFQDEFVPWTDALSVSAEYEHHGPVITLHATPGAVRRCMTSWLAFRRKPSPGPIKIRGRTLAVDPALLYHTLEYYLSRPEGRAELATDAAVQRVRAGDVAPR